MSSSTTLSSSHDHARTPITTTTSQTFSSSKHNLLTTSVKHHYGTSNDISELIHLSETTRSVVIDKHFRDSSKVKGTIQELKNGLNCEAHVESKNKIAKPKIHLIQLDDNETFFRVEKKKKKKASILLKDIKKVLTGVSFSETGVFHKYHENLVSKKKSLIYNPDWTVTIMFGSAQEQVDVVFKKVNEFISFLVAINYLLRATNLTQTPPFSVLMMRYWMFADENNDNKLSIQEINKLFKKLNIEINFNYLKKNFERFDVDKSGTIEFNEFIELFKEMHVVDEVEDLFMQCTNTNLMTVHEFVKFLHGHQSQSEISESQAIEIMKKNGAIEIDGQLCMPSFEFTSFVFSSDNSLVNPTLYTLHHDMDQPLTDYYIHSSHNTYLSGHQLKGESDVKNYRNGLLGGSRCVELDCWNGDHGEIVIYHGRTLTSKILFEDVIKCINDYSFVHSPYPVILSLDVHADKEGQEKMADIMIKIFGEKLFMPDEHMTRWPSPNQLKHRIILKNKKVPLGVIPTTPQVMMMMNGGEDSLLDSDSDDSEDEDDFSDEMSTTHTTTTHTTSTTTTSHHYHHGRNRDKAVISKVKVAQKLSDITALGTTKLTNFQDPSIVNLPCWKMFSLSEKKVEKLLNNEPMNLIKFNQNHFSRSYPHGLRFDSSNYDPTSSFVTGVHMSALNTQTHCAFYRINEFKFKENANSGYVLKPKILRAGSEEPFPDMEKSHVKQYIKLDIIMAKQVPNPKGKEKGEIVDPYVKVSILGHPRDNASYNTITVWDNGWNPTFNNTFEFKLVCPELASLQISIFDKNKVSADKFICENIIPVTALREGKLRSVQMFDEDMNLIEGCQLLCNLEILKVNQ